VPPTNGLPSISTAALFSVSCRARTAPSRGSAPRRQSWVRVVGSRSS